MKLQRTDLWVAAAIAVGVVWLCAAPNARCQNCVPEVCETGADCPDGCHCFVPYGESLGTCG